MFIHYEEKLLNAKPAPFQGLNHGFVMNFAGSEAFTSSIHPLYERNEYAAEKIDSCQDFCKEKGMDPCFRIVFQKDYQAFDDELFRQGYEKVGQGLVKHLDIHTVQKELFTFASFIQNGVFVEEELKEFWISEHAYLMDLDKEEEELLIDSVAKSPLKTVYFTFVEHNTLLGQGLAMFQGETMVIHTLVINPKFRALSYGKRLLMSMLSYGLQQGAMEAIADIDTKNVPALKLFHKIGFDDLYAYCYRRKSLDQFK